jgi:hypothetical protein
MLHYEELFGTDHKFSNHQVWRSLSVGMNTVIAVFGTECVNIFAFLQMFQCTW